MIAAALPVMADKEMLRLALFALIRIGEDVPAGWNALENDAQAFRLAAALQIGLHFRGISLTACYAARDEWCAEVWYKDDQYAATRRAIVAVAAMKGRYFEALSPEGRGNL